MDETKILTEVEETLQRMESYKGVTGTMVVNAEDIPTQTTSDNSTIPYAGLLHQPTVQAESTVYETDPQNELAFLRIRSRNVKLRQLHIRTVF